MTPAETHAQTVREYVNAFGYEVVWTVDEAEPEIGKQPSLVPRDQQPILAALDWLVDRIAHAEMELRYTHDRGDHLVYRHEWEEFDRWQRWANDQRKDAEKFG